MDIMKIALHGYNNISELTTEELKMLIIEIVDIEEVLYGLDELYKREPESAVTLGKNIPEEKLGDVYLQASIFYDFFKRDKEYCTDFTAKNLNELDPSMFECILECLTMESEQEYGKNFSNQLLSRIIKRHALYSEEERNKMAEEYDLSLFAYREKIDTLSKHMGSD